MLQSNHQYCCIYWQVLLLLRFWACAYQNVKPVIKTVLFQQSTIYFLFTVAVSILIHGMTASSSLANAILHHGNNENTMTNVCNALIRYFFSLNKKVEVL